MKERTKLVIIIGIYAAAYFVPWSDPVIRRSGIEAFMMLQEYAREHVLTCLVPAFFIAGPIAVFVNQAVVFSTIIVILSTIGGPCLRCLGRMIMMDLFEKPK
jgi:uncharacterized membrane protein YraQ (UPF0718 family)